MRIIRRNFLILLLAILSLVSYLPVARAADPLPSGITVGPPLAEYTIEQGQTMSGVVNVNNYAPAPITLYPQVMDFAAKNESGEPAFLETDPNRKYSLSSWIKFSPEPIILDIGEIVPVQYQMVVPQDAESGGHYGVIFFSTKAPQEVKEGEARIGANIKVGQLVLVTVPGDIREEGVVASFAARLFSFLPNIHLFKEGTKFTDFDFDPRWDWNIPIETRIENTGNVHFKPQGNITVKNIIGQEKATLAVNESKGNVLPEMTRKFENTWVPAWWQAGIYKANLDLTYGADNKALTDSQYMVVIPWWLVLILVVIVIYIIRSLRKRKKKRV
jgi:hypothetical protein